MVIASITHSITQFVGDRSVYAVFLLMAVDAVFPAFSELVMVYGGVVAGGAIASSHVMLFGSDVHSHASAYVVIALAGTLGYLVGSWVGWGIGRIGGRPLLERHGRWFHLGPKQLERADAWFARRGLMAVLLGRVTPLVRSFVSIPAGYGRVPLAPYSVLTLIGSAVWCFLFALIGLAVGSQYHNVNTVFEVVEGIVLVAVVLWLVRLVARRRRGRAVAAEPPA